MTHFQKYKISVAPMMDRTDRHFRYMIRLMSKKTLLYTEMVTTGAILYGDRERFLQFNPEEQPLSLQLGGSNPQEMADCAQIAEEYGYDEVNINVGCPSSRVQKGRIGACLMAEPKLVHDCVVAMKKKTNLPITVKHRIGIDDYNTYDFMHEFVNIVKDAGVTHFTAHARIALLNGLDPKQNRTIPPLRYHDIYQLKNDFPDLFIEINGGIKTFSEIKNHLNYVDAVMLGRISYDQPAMYLHMDEFLENIENSEINFNDKLPRIRIAKMMKKYIQLSELEKPNVGKHIIKRVINLMNGVKGARKWRQNLTINSKKATNYVEKLEKGITEISLLE